MIQKKCPCGYIPATEAKVKRSILRLLNVVGHPCIPAIPIPRWTTNFCLWASDSCVPNSHSDMKKNNGFWSTIETVIWCAARQSGIPTKWIRSYASSRFHVQGKIWVVLVDSYTKSTFIERTSIKGKPK